MLRIKLQHLDSETNRRREIANYYISNICNPRIGLPSHDDEENHVWHLFVVKVKERSHLKEYLESNHVLTLIHYPIPPYNQEAFSGYFQGNWTVSTVLHNEVISLPMSPTMSQDDVEYVVRVINNYGE